MIGILTSSINIVIFFPAGGPNVFPTRLSTKLSIVRYEITIKTIDIKTTKPLKVRHKDINKEACF